MKRSEVDYGLWRKQEELKEETHKQRII